MTATHALIVFMLLPVATLPQQRSSIEDIVVQWAPLIWLAPGEKHFPMNIEEFLSHVYPTKEDNLELKNPSANFTLPLGKDSKHYYLVSKRNLEFLKNEPSFLRGQNPKDKSVPIYVTVSDCSSPSSLRDLDFENLDSQLHFQVTYWAFYPYNEGKEVCFMGKFPAPFIFNTCLGRKKTMGNHVGDWEHMSLYFNGEHYPEEMFLAVHDAGVYYRFDPRSGLFKYKRQETRKGLVQRPKFPPTVRFSEGHPVLFAAYGSHGLWSAPGDHYFVRVPKLYDTNGYGTPWRTWENLEIYNTNSPPSWMRYRGKWGNPKSKCLFSKKLGLCEFSDGPSGILLRKRDFSC